MNQFKTASPLNHSSDDALLCAESVSLKRSGRLILDQVSLAIHPREVVVVIGPNGAGKTSLLRVLLGLWPTDAGQVRRRRGLRIGYMPQRVYIDPILPLSVQRFLTLSHRAAPGELRRVLEDVGVAQRMSAPIQTLSGGEMQRVLLARALLSRPDILVLDEPDQGVDVVGQGEVFALIDRLRQDNGCGVLMVSHELHLVMAAADTVICMQQHVCCRGRPSEIQVNPEFLRLFPEANAQAIGVYTHHHDHHHAVTGAVVPADTLR